MAPLGPLTTNRLTVRLDPERAARIEYWATENPLQIKSYNQLATHSPHPTVWLQWPQQGEVKWQNKPQLWLKK